MKILGTLLLLFAISPIPSAPPVSSRSVRSAGSGPSLDLQDEISAVEDGLLPAVVASDERVTV